MRKFTKIREQDWREDALCRQLDSEMFFPDRHDSITIPDAKAACSRCVVNHECLLWALGFPAQEGIQGGMTFEERNDMRAQAREMRVHVSTLVEPALVA